MYWTTGEGPGRCAIIVVGKCVSMNDFTCNHKQTLRKQETLRPSRHVSRLRSRIQ